MYMHHYVIDDLLPLRDRFTLIQPIAAAYKGLEKLVRDNSVFDTELSQRTLPRIRSLFVEKAVQDFAARGRIPFTCRIAQNSIRSYPYLVLESDRCIIDICQTAGEKRFPRPVHNRDVRSASSQISMLESEDEIPGKLYCVLTHGGRIDAPRPKFICFGRPNPENRKWQECKNLLSLQLHNAKNEPADIGDDDLIMGYTEEAMELLREDGKNGRAQ